VITNIGFELKDKTSGGLFAYNIELETLLSLGNNQVTDMIPSSGNALEHISYIQIIKDSDNEFRIINITPSHAFHQIKASLLHSILVFDQQQSLQRG
jgi:hypothetical protein